jgi:hypothetical protein
MNAYKYLSGLLIYLAPVFVLITGCDRFHEARITIDPRIIRPEAKISLQEAEVKVTSAVRDFASTLKMTCETSQRPLYILECGPHGKLSLGKENDSLVVTLFQMWGDSKYFCEVQMRMFDYFPAHFNEMRVTTVSNDACGRKN